jgi:hypothetical protein
MSPQVAPLPVPPVRRSKVVLPYSEIPFVNMVQFRLELVEDALSLPAKSPLVKANVGPGFIDPAWAWTAAAASGRISNAVVFTRSRINVLARSVAIMSILNGELERLNPV